jgi:hypothetical protein
MRVPAEQAGAISHCAFGADALTERRHPGLVVARQEFGISRQRGRFCLLLSTAFVGNWQAVCLLVRIAG